jgi:hypothetical protein
MAVRDCEVRICTGGEVAEAALHPGENCGVVRSLRYGPTSSQVVTASASYRWNTVE